MDLLPLIEEITRLVCERLEALDGAPVLAPAAVEQIPSKRVLLAFGRAGGPGPSPDLERCGEQLKAGLEGVAARCEVVGSELNSLGPLPLTRRDAGWDCDVLVLPHVPIGLLAKLALLIADEPAVEAALHALLNGRPVLAVTDSVDFLLSHEAQYPRGVLDVIRSHRRGLQSLGMRLLKCGELSAALTAALGKAAPVVSGSRPVVTREDVENIARQGQQSVVYPRGAIITPLAWETASRLGITIGLG
ncbi:MAG: hypothetical protein ACYCW6_14730 [Candidatus Xenobia bacterium]